MSFEQFATDNIFWFSLLAFVLGLIVVYELRNRGASGQSASPALAAQLANQGAVLIDLRTPNEYRQGHIAGSKNIPADQLQQKMQSSKIKQDKTIVTICKSGISAKTQAQWLRQQGFNQVYVLTGGIDAWQQENLPLVK